MASTFEPGREEPLPRLEFENDSSVANRILRSNGTASSSGPAGHPKPQLKRITSMPARRLFLVPAIALGLLACLPKMRAPTLVGWKLTLLAGEFGPLPGTVSLILAFAAAWSVRKPRIVTFVACAVLAIVVILFFKPAFQATRIAAQLPAEMDSAFGPTMHEVPPFRFSGLLEKRGSKVPVGQHAYAHVGTTDELSLDFYRPSKSAGSRATPCVVAIHGGGWDGGTRDQIPALYHRLASRGYAVAAISYRLAPRHPWRAQRSDVLAALAFLKREAAKFSIDPKRFVLFGRSAGGQIASVVAYTANDPAIRGVAAFYAPHDMNFAWSHGRADDVLNTFLLLRQYLGGTPQTVPANYESASAILHVKPGITPPTLLVHDTIDTLVWRRQSERLAARLREGGVPCVFLELPWATHAFDFSLRGPGGQLAAWALEEFLHSVTL